MKTEITKTTSWLTRGYTEEELAKMKEEAIKEAEAELQKKQAEKKTYVRSDIKESIEDYREIEEALEFQLMASNVAHTSSIFIDKRHAYILLGLLKEKLSRVELEERLGKDSERAD